jgi:hypothetical protein
MHRIRIMTICSLGFATDISTHQHISGATPIQTQHKHNLDIFQTLATSEVQFKGQILEKKQLRGCQST